MTSNEARLGLRLSSRSASEVGESAPRSAHAPQIHSIPENVVWGHIPPERVAIARVQSEAPFVVHTVSHRGLIEGTDPVTFFASHGVAETSVLPDVISIYEHLQRDPGVDGHLLTGPIEIAGAEQGDAVELRVIAADLRVPYGVNATRPGQGLLPDLLASPSLRVLFTTPDGRHITLTPGVSVPVAPFPGFIATAPPIDQGAVGSRIPSWWGGNLDLKWLTEGSSIFLPVSRPGAMIYLGDPHAAQGHGEVNGTAVEQSASFRLVARVHRGLAPRSPVVLTPTSVICTGVAPDMRSAMRIALQCAIELAIGWTDGELDVASAYALCSIAADAGVAEVVNGADVAFVSLPREVLGPRRDGHPSREHLA